MKTVYLKGAKSALIADINKVFQLETKEGLKPYAGEIEFGNADLTGHYIGDIMLTQPILNDKFEVITKPTFAGAEHANLYVPDDFDSSIFKCEVPEPNNPKHTF